MTTNQLYSRIYNAITIVVAVIIIIPISPGVS